MNVSTDHTRIWKNIRITILSLLSYTNKALDPKISELLVSKFCPKHEGSGCKAYRIDRTTTTKWRDWSMAASTIHEASLVSVCFEGVAASSSVGQHSSRPPSWCELFSKFLTHTQLHIFVSLVDSNLHSRSSRVICQNSRSANYLQLQDAKHSRLVNHIASSAKSLV